MSYLQHLLLFFVSVLFVGLFMLRRRAQQAERVLLAAVTGLFLLSWPPLVPIYSLPLEARYKRVEIPQGNAEVMVVISGNIARSGPADRQIIADTDTYSRCARAAWLYRHWRPLPIVVSGGSSPDIPEPASVVMKQLLQDSGVPGAAISTEDRARSTYENAVYTAELLRAKGLRRILLVTDASHMVRAEMCFRKAGLEVMAAPCNFHTFHFNAQNLSPFSRAIEQNEKTFHELLGLVWYRLRGRI